MSISAFGDAYFPDTLRPCFFLSHSVSSRPPDAPPSNSHLWSRYYTPGNQDFLFVLGWSLIFTVLRWIVMKLFRKAALWWIPAPSKTFSVDPPSNGRPESAYHGNGLSYALTHSDPKSHGNELHSRRGRADDEPVQKSERRRVDKDLRKAERARQRTATRFAEQGFAFLYYSHAWLLGLVCHLASYDVGITG